MTVRYDPDRHDRRWIRLKGFDYTREGAYFVTVCARNRLCHFAEIVEGKMNLNDAGGNVEEFWDAIPAHFPKVELDA